MTPSRPSPLLRGLRSRIYRRWIGWPLVLIFLILGGCASTEQYDTPGDPLESFNREVYRFNEGFDEAILLPLAKGYRAVTPDLVDRGITNAFNNVADLVTAANNVLQFKLLDGIEDLSRVVVNTGFGLGGFIDIATGFGIPRHTEDFGQTLGFWGVGSGPYLVVPIFGPSNFRDAAGRVVDALAFDPVSFIGADTEALQYGLATLRVVDQRADLLSSAQLLDVAAWDQYAFVREAYNQRRADQIRDGAPDPEFDTDSDSDSN